MAFRSETVGTPAACVAAVQAMTSGTLGAAEVAMLTRQITNIVTEINAYANQTGALRVTVEGGNNFDSAWIKWRIESVGNLGSGTFTTPPSQTPPP